jgi:hypothetical protein
MKKRILLSVLIAFAFSFYFAPITSPQDHPGKPVKELKPSETPGKSVIEHPGKPISADFVKKSIRSHVKAVSKEGIFSIRDEKLKKDWKLKMDKIHDPVRVFEKEGKTIYFTCVDFKSVNTKDTLDLDFWLVPKGEKLEVIDTKIHKVNGEARFGYEGTELKEIK